MSKCAKKNTGGTEGDRNKWIMVKICKVMFIVFLQPLPRDPELRKKIWPFELYLIRMIYKKTNLVVILYKIISYRRLLNNRELSWGSRPIAWWYQLTL